MKELIVIGAGYMGQEYAKVLLDQNVDFAVIGRSAAGVENLKREFPKVQCQAGGIEQVIATQEPPKYAIVATNVNTLSSITRSLLQWGVRNILVEKPLCFHPHEAEEIMQLARQHSSRVYIAYNRRYYRAVQAAQALIKEDGGLTSVHFEFTEWVNRIDSKKFDPDTLKHWVIANSSHVIDLVFHLAGKPKELTTWVTGNEVDWHPSGSIFMGGGFTEQNIPVNYYSNWRAPGRWSIQFSTRKHRLHFAPMEQLALQKIDSVKIEPATVDYDLDQRFKPGVYGMVSDFLSAEPSSNLCTLAHTQQMLKVYREMAGYK